MQSGVYREKLDQTSRDKMDAMQQVRDTDLRNHDADYQRHQQQRIAEQEAHLTKHHELNIKCTAALLGTADHSANRRSNPGSGQNQCRKRSSAKPG